MNRTFATSDQAARALALVEALQARFVRGLEKIGREEFQHVEWLRDEGRHGGGQRFGVENTELLGRASVNVSQIHYNAEADRKLASATAISTIVHPAASHAPSVHIHISWTEMKPSGGGWRVMADLNPSTLNAADKVRFLAALQKVAPETFADAVARGDRYFFIPALGRPRGVAHFYLEKYNSGDFAADLMLAKRVGEAAIDTYLDVLEDAARENDADSDEARTAQLAYHTLYFFQVLTLDRGTTTGLLAHDQNDVGVLGSLPPRIDKNLFASWRTRVPELQERLVEMLLAALPNQGVCEINDAVKRELVAAVRAFYKQCPAALDLQASGGD